MSPSGAARRAVICFFSVAVITTLINKAAGAEGYMNLPARIAFFCAAIVFANYLIGVIIKPKKGIINFPAKNHLSSFMDFITFRFFLGYFWRRTVKITDINYIHGQIKHINRGWGSLEWGGYELNCAGKIGSINLAFSSVQKRDEAIGAIKIAAEEHNHKIEFRNILY